MRHTQHQSPHALAKVVAQAARAAQANGIPPVVIAMTREPSNGSKRSIPVGVHTFHRTGDPTALLRISTMAVKNQGLTTNIYKA